MLVSGCTVGPDYVKPDTAGVTPAAWRWQTGVPRDAEPRGEWWRVFRDGELDRLEGLAVAGSPSLAAAAARVDQARVAAQRYLATVRLIKALGGAW